MKSFISAFIKCKVDVYDRRDRAAAEVLLKIQRFLESGSYSSCKKAGDIVSLSIKGYSVNTIAEKYRRSPETIRSEKRKISEELWRIFPYDFFDYFADFKNNSDYFKDFLYSIGEYNSKSENFILVDVLNRLSGLECDSDDIYSISDLRTELDFLLRYSDSFLSEELRNVDVNKLKYIIDVLDYKIVDNELRVALLKEFKREV